MNNTNVAFEDLGMVVFQGVVPLDMLEQINETIAASQRQTHGALSHRGSDMVRSFADLLRQSDAFRRAESDACAASLHAAVLTFGPTLADNVVYVLRCIDRDAQWQSYLRHFDSHYLTLLIPLKLAEKCERNGDLILYKKRRRSVSLVNNVFTKAWLFTQQNFPFQIRRAVVMNDLRQKRCARVAIEPGNLYAFNGFLTKHANLDVTAGERRTLIIHYYDPGLRAGLHTVTRIVRTLRGRVTDVR
jgi:hypothetical protein